MTDGEITLILQPDKTGGFAVSSPIFPELQTQAESIEEAFENAYDAFKALGILRR